MSDCYLTLEEVKLNTSYLDGSIYKTYITHFFSYCNYGMSRVSDIRHSVYNATRFCTIRCVNATNHPKPPAARRPSTSTVWIIPPRAGLARTGCPHSPRRRRCVACHRHRPHRHPQSLRPHDSCWAAGTSCPATCAR